MAMTSDLFHWDRIKMMSLSEATRCVENVTGRVFTYQQILAMRKKGFLLKDFGEENRRTRGTFTIRDVLGLCIYATLLKDSLAEDEENYRKISFGGRKACKVLAQSAVDALEPLYVDHWPEYMCATCAVSVSTSTLADHVLEPKVHRIIRLWELRDKVLSYLWSIGGSKADDAPSGETTENDASTVVVVSRDEGGMTWPDDVEVLR